MERAGKRLDFLALAKARKTTYEFTDKKIKDSDLLKVLEAGRWAPSFLNLQPWSFIIVRDKDKIDKLVGTCAYGGFHSPPPLLIAVVLEPTYQMQKGLQKDNLKEFIAYHEYACIACSVSNLLHEATALGISSCILSPRVDAANSILKVAKQRRALFLVGLGYERKGAFQKKRERNPIEELVHYEQYEGKR